MKNQKGITLIALVVTIVVLLILAGVSIAMLSGENGIITQAQNAKYANTEGEVIDNIKFAFSTVNTSVIVGTSTKEDYEIDVDAMVTAVQNQLKESNYTVEKGTDANSIDITYSDSIFGDGKKFNAITATITIEDDTLSLSPITRQVDVTE